MFDQKIIKIFGGETKFIPPLIAGCIGDTSSLKEEFCIMNAAAVGAAYGNNVVLVDTPIAQGTSKDSAVKGAALGNHEELVDKLIKKGASRDWAVEGAAEGNHEDLCARLKKLQLGQSTYTLLGRHAEPCNEEKQVIELRKETRSFGG